MTTMQLQSFDQTSRDWKTLAEALVEYGYEVFRVWGVTGLLRTRAALHNGGRGVLGLPKLPEALVLDEAEAIGLSIDLNMTSIQTFRHTLMNPTRRWRPDGGASIKTYYVGRCLMDLPDVYVRWVKQEKGEVEVVALDEETRHPAFGDPAETHDRRARFEAAVPNHRDRAMFGLQDAGYTLDEIAEILDPYDSRPVTEAVVRTAMSRARAKAT